MGLYLGIDASTQGMKAELIDTDTSRFVGSYAVNFGMDLPQYAAPDGFIPDANPLVKQANPLMWLDALELLFARMRKEGVPMEQIAGISGSGQQHGTVYLNSEFVHRLRNLNSESTLSEQLQPTFSRTVSPIWMDRSTTTECRELEARFGNRLQEDTGSPAVERFAGPQIRRFAVTEPESYARTAVIHLVSSFLCSVLIGESAPIDYGDGAGMNLLNLKTLRWDEEITAFTAPELVRRLPPVVTSQTQAGTLHPYFAKYRFKSGIPVVVWSGDNPSSLIGVGGGSPGVAVISLGTSDTFFAAMSKFKTDPSGCGHVFGNPAGGFMSLICFTNGSLAREKIRRECDSDWKSLDRTVSEQTLPGNHGKLLLPYFEPESTPLVLEPRVVCNFDFAAVSAAERIRAIMESQALSMKLHSAWQDESFQRIIVTGGAAGNASFKRILADVFQAEIATIGVGNSAGLGAAIRAANVVEQISFDALTVTFCGHNERLTPDPTNADLYQRMLAEYAELEPRAEIQETI